MVVAKGMSLSAHFVLSLQLDSFACVAIDPEPGGLSFPVFLPYCWNPGLQNRHFLVATGSCFQSFCPTSRLLNSVLPDPVLAVANRQCLYNWVGTKAVSQAKHLGNIRPPTKQHAAATHTRTHTKADKGWKLCLSKVIGLGP